jgi:hypothetical protein
MTGPEFVELSRQLRELGATTVEVTAEGACRATFAPPGPSPVVMTRRPLRDSVLDESKAPVSARAAYRDSVRERLNG